MWQAMSVALGLLVFAALMWWAAKTHAHLWRLALKKYPKRRASRADAKKLETILIARRGALGPSPHGEYRRYAGVILGVHHRGLSLSLVPPFNLLCPPIDLPFDEMELQPTYWALWPDPLAIRMRNLPDFDIILAHDTVGWIRDRTKAPPFGL